MKLIHANKKRGVPEYQWRVAGRKPTGALHRAIRNYFRDPTTLIDPGEYHSI